MLTPFSYIASDGNCYGLDVTADRDISQIFRGSHDTRQSGGSHARLVKVGYLLNSKAYSYLSRIGPDRAAKMAVDADDILFLAAYMRRHRLSARRNESRWVVDYDFWTLFCSAYRGAEQAFQSIGLQRDATPSSSNRQTRNSSMSLHSRGSSRNGSGESRRR